MGFRYRKSIKIAPGVKLNVGKKSVGVSVGNKYGGISVNSKTGASTRVSVPGTGISYTEKINIPKTNTRKTITVYEPPQNQNRKTQIIKEVEQISFNSYDEYLKYSDSQKKFEIKDGESDRFNILLIAFSILFIMFFGVLFAFSETTEGAMTFGSWIVYMLILTLFMVLPIDMAIYFSHKNNYKDKAKKRAIQLLKEVDILFEFINTTLDENIFFSAYEKLIKVFEELAEYEIYGFFKDKVSKERLIEVKQNREVLYSDFLERLSLHKSKK